MMKIFLILIYLKVQDKNHEQEKRNEKIIKRGKSNT